MVVHVMHLLGTWAGWLAGRPGGWQDINLSNTKRVSLAHLDISWNEQSFSSPRVHRRTEFHTRNFLKSEEAEFMAVSEYTPFSQVGRGRNSARAGCVCSACSVWCV